MTIEQQDAFLIIEAILKEREAQNLRITNLAIGNPDLTPDPQLLEDLGRAVVNPTLHGYSAMGDESKLLMDDMRDYYRRRFHVDLASPQILDLLGTKEGIFYAIFATHQPGDIVLVPDVTYPIYAANAKIARCVPYVFPTTKQFQPNLSAIPEDLLQRARSLILCSPNNPTGMLLSESTLKEAITLCARYNILLIHDIAYADLCYPKQPISCLSLPGGKETCVELYSLSKSCAVAGWRVGFLSGNSQVVAAVRDLKFYIDFGGFQPILRAARTAVKNLERLSSEHARILRSRAQVARDTAKLYGWDIPESDGPLFLWTELPPSLKGMSDREFVVALARSTGVVLAPGSGFGPAGKDYVRIALVQPEDIIVESFHRIGAFLSEHT